MLKTYGDNGGVFSCHISHKEVPGGRVFHRIIRVERYYSKKETEEAVANPVLVHMTSSFWIVNRPWCKVTNHPMKDVYKKYADLTPWGEPLSEDCRGEMKKFTDFVVQRAPKAMVISFTSFLYNTTRVKQIGAEINRYRGTEK